MRRHVSFRPQAEAEALEVRGWYEERRQGLGAEFGQAVNDIIDHISENPQAFPRAHGASQRP